ncbi:MAG: hypothetical protein FWD69_08445 [Polyangiaceae bacterium]|nr:hypothetical protein [Polyangiaceae bacterium]
MASNNAGPGGPPTSPRSPGTAWASGTLLLAGAVGILAKVGGVLIAPGMRGIAAQGTVETTEILTSALGYTFAAMLVTLASAGAFELTRSTRISVLVRGIVVAVCGLVIALVSPAVVQKLHPFAAITLSIVASMIAFVAGITAARIPHTRALGAVLVLLSLSGILRPNAWGLVALAGEHASLTLFNVGRILGTISVIVQCVATLLVAVWLAMRSRTSRIFANGAVVLGFVITYVAARNIEDPSSTIAILRASLLQVATTSVSRSLSSVAAFLIPASLLLAVVALAQRRFPPAITVSFALALLSQGSFDVPLQALAITAAAMWTLLAMADDRAMWTTLVATKRTK